MSISAYHTTQIDHVYEPLYLVIYGHYEMPGSGFDFSHGGVRAEFTNNAIIAEYQMKTILL